MEELQSQLITLTILAAFGVYLGKKEVVNDSGSRVMSSLLMRFILPLIIIESFLRPFDIQEFEVMALVFVLSLGMMCVRIMLSRLAYGRFHSIERYATIFNNKGYIGIPIIRSILGPAAIFYVVPTIIVSNLFVWTYGASLLEGKSHSFQWKKLLINPSTIGFSLGMALYLLPLTLPQAVQNAIHLMTDVNTPLAMLMLGYFLSQEPLRGIIWNRQGWLVAAFRLLIYPFLSVLFLWMLPVGDAAFKTTLAIAAACPTAINLSLQAKLTGHDPSRAAQMTSLNSILCVLTIPLVYQVAQWLF